MRLLSTVLLLPLAVLAVGAAPADRATINFNPAWRFVRADPAGAPRVDFDDSAWTVVAAPHTFNDIDTFDNWSLPGHRGEQEQWSGRTWYRKIFAAPAAWRGKLGPDNHAGGANWIFSDSTSGGRVAVEVARASGEVDGVRLPKEAYYVAQVMYTYEPRVHVIGHWSYPAGTKKHVFAVANTGGEVELFVNGRSLGRAKPENRFLYRFAGVAFESGEIKAVAHNAAGTAVATAVKRTVGGAVALRVTPLVGPDGWRADGSDVALIDVEAVDANGQRVPPTATSIRPSRISRSNSWGPIGCRRPIATRAITRSISSS